LLALECPAFAARRQKRAAVAQPSAAPGDAAPAIVLASGEGCELVDVDGRRYVDLTAGFGSVLLGHGAAELTQAIADQSARLVQGLGDVYASDVKVELLRRLARFHADPAARVLLTQSGSDAVAAALKTAALATGRPGWLAFDGAYHGLGYGPLAACGYRASFRAPFDEQLNPQVCFAPYPGVRGATAEAALEHAEQHLKGGNVGAVLIEPVLGRGGCVVPPDGFVAELCQRAHAHGALVVADEIWTGMGRCGAWLRSDMEGAHADIVCLGKGLGGGVPISACIASDDVMGAWARGGEVVHTSTHAGAPLACAAALATLDAVHQRELAKHAAETGRAALRALRERLGAYEAVREVRGVGLMMGVALDGQARALAAVGALLERGFVVITGGVAGDTLTLSPPLVVQLPMLEAFGDALANALESGAC
jgi:4-aminobutyrate aminotransferase/(S)-3-amino-2-methylpropionate transaminase